MIDQLPLGTGVQLLKPLALLQRVERLVERLAHERRVGAVRLPSAGGDAVHDHVVARRHLGMVLAGVHFALEEREVLVLHRDAELLVGDTPRGVGRRQLVLLRAVGSRDLDEALAGGRVSEDALGLEHLERLVLSERLGLSLGLELEYVAVGVGLAVDAFGVQPVYLFLAILVLLLSVFVSFNKANIQLDQAQKIEAV